MSAHGDTLAPNHHLRIDGVPPVPRALVDGVGPYTQFKPVDVVAWHPMRRWLLVAHRHGATSQLHLLDRPMGTPTLLTDFADPVVAARFEPHRGDYLVFSRDNGGNEAAQLYRYDLADRQTTPLTDPTQKHGLAEWNHAGDRIAFASTRLDGSGAGGDVTTELSVVDPLDPVSKRHVISLPGGGWGEFHWSHDDRAFHAREYRSVTDSSVWRIDLDRGTRRRILPAADRVASRTVAYAEVHPTRDGERLVYASDEDGEFRELTVLDLATGQRRVLTRDIPWDVVAITMQGGTHGGRSELVAAIVNRAGRHELHVYDVDSGDAVALPALPSGSVSRVRFAQSGDTDEIAFTVNSASSPGDVYTLILRSPDASVAQWTRAAVDGIDADAYREAAIVTWPSFDGRAISGLITRPPTRWTGRRPVLIHIHGGPESQAAIGFLGINNWFVDALGIAYIQPNVRGSAGYGRSFVSLDDGMLREDSVRDIGALLDWIAQQPDLDASRVLVAGRSYGGYMSLAVATNYAERIVASIAIVGISHFTTFLERTESYRRDLRRVEYGDERDPAIRAFFDRISPLSNADRIRKPLLVVAGRNDPRVPWQEGEQIVAKLKDNGVPVWHVVADDEGHVFSRKPNIDYVFYAQALFVQRYLID